MSQTLYRKYRPNKFNEVIGQDKIVSALENSIKTGKVGHAYIFAGSRGTGKTTIARIFADALSVSQNDLYEIDAASNRGIDDIRAIKDAVNTLPFDSKYKVYIIDEAHMLTREAWNALLKTLEEPPAHVIFVLATTEIEKIPDTIMSRCESYLFRKPDQSVLKQVITKTAKKEGYEIEEEASDVLALIADGSFRDAHGALQKIISSLEGKNIILKDVEDITGAPKSESVNNLLRSIDGKDISKAIGVIDNIRQDNLNIKAFTRLLIEKVRTIILMRISSDFETKNKDILSKENFVFLKAFADKRGKDTNINSETLLKLLDIYEKISYSSLPDVVLEAGLINLLED
jgi:DNA polymerase III subunit gamma/tau